MNVGKNGGRTTFSKVYLSLVTQTGFWDAVTAMQVDNHNHFGIRKSKQLLQNLLFATNINKSYSFVFNIDNSSGLRNRLGESRMGKETFAGDYLYLRVPTSGWLIPEVFPRKICPLRTPWKSGLPGDATFNGRVKDVGIAKRVENGVQPWSATITGQC